jgi:hypothetical protein
LNRPLDLLFRQFAWSSFGHYIENQWGDCRIVGARTLIDRLVGSSYGVNHLTYHAILLVFLGLIIWVGMSCSNWLVWPANSLKVNSNMRERNRKNEEYKELEQRKPWLNHCKIFMKPNWFYFSMFYSTDVYIRCRTHLGWLLTIFEKG